MWNTAELVIRRVVYPQLEASRGDGRKCRHIRVLEQVPKSLSDSQEVQMNHCRPKIQYMTSNPALALPEQHPPIHRWDDPSGVVDVRRPLTVPSNLEVVVEHNVRQHRLELVRRKEPTGANAGGEARDQPPRPYRANQKRI